MIRTDDADIGRRLVRAFDPNSDEYRVAAAAVENGTATYNSTSDTSLFDGPFAVDSAVAYNGSVYRFRGKRTDSRSVVSYTVTIDPLAEGADSHEDETVRFEDLPAVDQRQFTADGLADGTSSFVGTQFRYATAETDVSVVVPSPEFPVVVWKNGTRARVAVRESSTATVYTFRYTAERAAPTVAAYGEQVREQYAFALSGLSGAERTIVEEAISGRYLRESGTAPSTAERGLVGRFRSHEPVLDGDGTGVAGDYLVEYADAVYWATLSRTATAGE